MKLASYNYRQGTDPVLNFHFSGLVRTLTLIILVVALLPLQSHAETITVVTDTWENYTNPDGTGFYLDVLREVFPASRYSLQVEYLPYKRTITMVEQGKADITTGVSVGDIQDELIAMEYIEQDAVDLVVSVEMAQHWQGLQSLENKKVVAKIGYNFADFFDVPVLYSEKPILLGMMKMLGAHRVDGVLDYKNDIKKMWGQAGLGDDYVVIESVIVQKAYYAFSGNNPALKARFMHVFPRLVQSGKILEIGLKYGLDGKKLPQ